MTTVDFLPGDAEEGPPQQREAGATLPEPHVTGPAFKSQEELDAFLAAVGFEVFKIAATCSVMGWESPRGAVPYMHLEKPSPVWDLVLWTIGGDKAAKERMHAVGAEWAPTVMQGLADLLTKTPKEPA